MKVIETKSKLTKHKTRDILSVRSLPGCGVTVIGPKQKTKKTYGKGQGFLQGKVLGILQRKVQGFLQGRSRASSKEGPGLPPRKGPRFSPRKG